eukprot:CAMPEP_0182439268 /NCGR_PEP_ID=MMETSP1167-20130531/86332_1 /TAXON_ID=2988 /ORGANISM="Mallomonas Sp, Strain CCMP3275" /LENGTH=162 /DNA_ID=CAMNT_0024632929 /DNA_START=202 /DNA_END=687 /DNA_ORIENTATION=-
MKMYWVLAYTCQYGEPASQPTRVGDKESASDEQERERIIERERERERERVGDKESASDEQERERIIERERERERERFKARVEDEVGEMGKEKELVDLYERLLRLARDPFTTEEIFSPSPGYIRRQFRAMCDDFSLSHRLSLSPPIDFATADSPYNEATVKVW